MRRSLSLSLYLLVASRRGRPVTGGTATRAARPEGQVVWIAAGPDIGTGPLTQLCRGLLAERPKLTLVVTREASGADQLAPDLLPTGVHAETAPPDRPADVAALLQHWDPGALLLFGQVLPPAAILGCNERGIPVVLAGLGERADSFALGMFRRRLARWLLPRIDRILVADDAMSVALRDLAGDLPRMQVIGHLDDVLPPLTCNESERASLAGRFGTRGVWLAADCPADEEDAVLAAHGNAMRLAHRMLLILVPRDLSQGAAIADRFTREGFQVALRSNDEEPDPETQIYVADTEDEYGLWYRLAPLTFFGGTLWDAGPTRDPMEAAALGSAIICGARTKDRMAAFARLQEQKALRQVRSPTALAEAVAELIAPDRAAVLAHDAWAVSSHGAEVTERVVRAVFETLDRPPAAAATGHTAR